MNEMEDITKSFRAFLDNIALIGQMYEDGIVTPIVTLIQGLPKPIQEVIVKRIEEGL